jgi:hypothetical protein
MALISKRRSLSLADAREDIPIRSARANILPQLMLRMAFDEQKQLPGSASAETPWTAAAVITSAEHKGKMTANISQRGELSYQIQSLGDAIPSSF